MNPLIQNAALRTIQTTRELALYLRQISKEAPQEQVTAELLASVKSEAIPPDVFATYLSAVESPVTIVAALRQPFSRFVRRAAIKQFGKALKKPGWESVWNEVGGTEGLLSLLSEISVAEVDLLCKVIGWATQVSTKGNTLRQQRVTELLQGLLPAEFPEHAPRSQDDRPLKYRYACLLSACTSDFVKEWIDDFGGPYEEEQWPIRRIAENHWPMLQEVIIKTLRLEKYPAEQGPNETCMYSSFMERFLPFLLQDFPSAKGDRVGFSASMSFSFEVLRNVAEGADHYFEKKLFEPTLLLPLLRRAISKKASLETIREVIDLALLYLKEHPDSLKSSQTWKEDSFSAMVATSWSQQSRTLEPQLIDAMKHQSVGKTEQFPIIDGLFRVVSKNDRYDLFRLIMLHGHPSKADIDNDSDLRKLSLGKWPPSLFQSMSVEKAQELLGRLSRLKPERDFLAPGLQSSILSQSPSIGSSCGDPVLLGVLLNSGENAVVQAKKAIDRHKEQSFRSRDQTTRAFYAKSAAFYAIASGSLDQYDQVMLWSRRYVRDPLTAKTLYNRGAINTGEGIALLSGIPENLSHSNIHDICGLVIKGNEALVNLFETALSAINEPSFSRMDWDGVKSLFRDVVGARIKQSRRLKNALSLSEEDIYESLWPSTMEMLLRVEEMGLQSGHEALGFNSANGPLSSSSRQNLPNICAFIPSVCRFFDDLARARNELWEHHRMTLHSECASLPTEWPRGLPIQALAGDFTFGVCSPTAKNHTPYILSRSDVVLFAEKNPIITVDDLSEERRAAIGGFIDQYETALQVQVLQEKPGAEQEKQASAIFTHHLDLCNIGGPGSEGTERPTKAEAIDSCARVFQRCLPGVKVTAINEFEAAHSTGYPVLPLGTRNHEAQERLEWNPSEGKPQDRVIRLITATILDLQILAPSQVSAAPLRIPRPFVLTEFYTNVWSPQKISKVRRESRAILEGTIVSALLYLDSAVERKILTSAFPSLHDVRYPPLFLDQEFLESMKSKEGLARSAVSELIRSVPSTLLQAIAENALNALSNPDLESTERTSRGQSAYKILRLLLKSDRPELASNGILTTLINHPEASSWHRQLLKPSFVRALSKSDAQAFLDSFLSAINAKLDEQTRLRQIKDSSEQREPEPNGTPSPVSVIKVTTVKLLAQFLNDADVISTKTAISMLSSLVRKSSHRDVRLAIIESLRAKLATCSDNATDQVAEQIFQLFELFVPIAGSLDGNHDLEEKDWQLSEQTGNMPEVFVEGAPWHVTPIMKELCLTDGLSAKQQSIVMTRILLPAFLKSQVSNGRWVSLFAKKFGLDSGHLETMPTLPGHPQVLAYLVRWSLPRCPLWVLDLHQHHVLINLQRPAWLENINRSITSDPDFRNSNAAQHWLSLYNVDACEMMKIVNLATFLQWGWHPSAIFNKEEQIQPLHLQKCLLDQAAALLQLRDPSFRCWGEFIDRLSPPLRYPDGGGSMTNIKEGWQKNSKPVLEDIVALIDHTRMLQRRPGTAEPAFLPPTFSLRLLLLDYPQLFPNLTMQENVERFGSQLLTILREVQKLGLAHSDKLGEITEAAMNVYRSTKPSLAHWIGDIEYHFDQRRTLPDQHLEEILLRVELAVKLLQDLKLEKGEKAGVKVMIRLWIGSELEEVRLKGWRLIKIMGLDMEEEET